MAGRVFVTGDTHGSHDIGKLNSANFPTGRELDKDDFVIVCGDFGMPWADDAHDRYWLNWLNNKPWTTLFVDGNHENFDLLTLQVTREWGGAAVHVVRPTVLHLMRGQAYRIAGRSFFAMGGATSVDRDIRVPGASWWPQEIPSWEEFQRAEDAIRAHGGRFDYVLTHCAPSNFQNAIEPTFVHDVLTRWLFDVERGLSYERWFFGHYHLDLDLDDRGYRASCLFDRILELPYTPASID